MNTSEMRQRVDAVRRDITRAVEIAMRDARKVEREDDYATLARISGDAVTRIVAVLHREMTNTQTPEPR